MQTHLQYGRDGLRVDLPSHNVTILTPRFISGLADEAAAFREAVRTPIKTQPLKELIAATDRVAIVIPDITRPLPSERLLPWLLAELAHVPAQNFVIINGTGSHRVNTPAELEAMVGLDGEFLHASVDKDFTERVHDRLGADHHPAPRPQRLELFLEARIRDQYALAANEQEV